MAVLAAEERLKSLSCVAKSLSVIYAAHAHIDMNWEWGAQETVTAVIDTFQTMLDLMDEYPDFTFSQSQASTYEIIEKHCPSMLERIRARVQEGRWEVTASTWVEPDKNMTGTESMARHILYTKRYLSRLLGVSAESLNIDFEPDTFGHSANIPEGFLSQGGVKYYYHAAGLTEIGSYTVGELRPAPRSCVFMNPIGTQVKCALRLLHLFPIIAHAIMWIHFFVYTALAIMAAAPPVEI